MRRLLLALLLALVPALAHAEQLTDSTGVLAAAQTATGVSANTMVPSGATALYVDYTITSGTATIQVENQVHPAAAFRVVTGSSQSASSSLKIDMPVGVYQSNITACGSCNVTVRYQVVHPRP